MAIDCETIRKGVHEVESGLICLDNFSARGRKRAEEHFPDLLRDITTLVINLDNGPENHSRRTQFMYRIVEFVRQTHLTLYLAYYPPYHSRYNPVERCWGILENHWNGSILDTVEAVMKFTTSMTWSGIHPIVALITTVYQIGVRLTKDDMNLVEDQIFRLPGLEKWFICIAPFTISAV